MTKRSPRAASFDYDVALSFAGEDRQYADELAQLLKDASVRVFYDEYERANLWGKDLYVHLHEVYSKKARFCVLFASKHYAKKAWPSHERRAMQERAFREVEGDYILPVRIDDTDIPGLPATVGYPPISVGIPKIGELLLQKLASTRGHASGAAAPFGAVAKVYKTYDGNNNLRAVEFAVISGACKYWRIAFPSDGPRPVSCGVGPSGGGSVDTMQFEYMEGTGTLDGRAMNYVGAKGPLTAAVSAYVVFAGHFPDEVAFASADNRFDMPAQWKPVDLSRV